MAPVIHEWTYEALVYDLLSLDDNIIRSVRGCVCVCCDRQPREAAAVSAAREELERLQRAACVLAAAACRPRLGGLRAVSNTPGHHRNTPGGGVLQVQVRDRVWRSRGEGPRAGRCNGRAVGGAAARTHSR